MLEKRNVTKAYENNPTVLVIAIICPPADWRIYNLNNRKNKVCHMDTLIATDKLW